MSSFRFVIPLKLEDLTASSNNHQAYVVSNEYGSREASQLLTEIRDRFTLEGPEFILDKFDVFYSILVNFKSLEHKVKLDAWKIIYKAVTSMVSTFFDLNVSRDASGSENSDRSRNCNIFKMLLFIYCTLMELFEDQDAKHSSDIEAQNVGKGKKKPVKKDESFDWSRDRERGVELLLRLFSLSLHQLFTPPVVEDEVVNCVTKCCWKILEKPSTSKNKQLCSNLFSILGITVEKYRQSLAQLVEAVVKQSGQRIIMSELFLEVGRIDIRDLSRDSSAARAISTFLTDVAERCPNEVLPSISQVLSYLDEDAYMMRNATLSIIGCLVSKSLSSEEMDIKSRNLRDTLLDKLEDHILDTNAFSRGRALQVWSRLCDEGKIPLTRLETLIAAVVGRLKDRTSYVRKNAVQFLTSFLKENPFAAKLSLQTVQEAYNKEKDKLKKMMESAGNENVDEDMNKEEDYYELWDNLESEIIHFYNEIESSQELDEEDPEDALNTTVVSNCNSVDDVFKRFRDLVCGKKFKSAFKLLKVIKDQWGTHSIFSTEDIDMDDTLENDVETDDKSDVPEFIKLCKRAFTETVSPSQTLTLDSRRVVKELEEAATVLIQSASQENATTTTNTPASNNFSEENLVVEINKQQILVKYLCDCIKFAEEVKTAIPLVCDLLQSKNITDVQEAINFFVTAYEFGVQGAIIGIRKMLPLVFSQETAVKEAVMSAYKNIYLESSQLNQLNSRNKAIAVVKSLTELVSGATVGEEISLEELLKQFMATGYIENIYVQVMWERFAMKIPNTTQEESQIAVLLIAMIANSDSKMIKQNLDTLIDVGLSDRANDDLLLVTNTCIALRKAVDNQGRLDLKQSPYRFERDHKLFERLSHILVITFQNLNVHNWGSMCDEALKVIFLMAENPDFICETIVKSMINEMISNFKNNSQNGEQADEITETAKDGENSQETSAGAESDSAETNINLDFGCQKLNSEILTRFITFVGSLALNILIHLEVNIFTELKIRNALKEEKSKRKSINKTPRIRRSAPMTPKTPGGDNLEEEIGLGGAGAVDDAEAEFISHLCDDEIVEKFGEQENLIARMSPIVVAVASDPIRYQDVKLRTAATLALAKFMAVSEKFCSKHLQLFFTILEKSSESVIRANSVIAVGDLCIRYPNLLDPWTSQLYSPLRDRDVVVRTCALKVLSRLILSDMIKVKGQISEMAVLIVDEESNLSSMARLFFTELGKKQNAIYNVLPDIISHLSDTEFGIEEESFKIIMKYLFDLIGKDRQTVCLVEKLCQRFRMTTNERQWRDLAFCLSLLTFSERSLAKLYENLICFADKLTNDFVHETLISIIGTSRKLPNIKNETKQLLDEFEHKINECRSKGINEDDSELREIVGPGPQRAASSTTKKSTRKPAASAQKGRGNQRKPSKSAKKVIDFDEDDEDDFVCRSAVKNKEKTRSLRERKKVAQIFDDSDDEDD
ncbi:condensin complex subunit 1-like isoform X1 [Leptotrombidium deliense]|uniref:Condensin complex subunit 1 n=1 Tax=Leptotrombidium deliense TaxID=299467 RepID=A0A443SI12_9ACAR|nr:condensin complex subunit 1-like isoform X1 [Leptotrombidium deliense]